MPAAGGVTNPNASEVDVDKRTSKTCSLCQQDLPVEAFNRRSASADGLQPKCRNCERARKRQLACMSDEERADARAAKIADLKPCSDCGVIKPLASYPKKPRKIDGRGSRCLKCDNAKRRKAASKRRRFTDAEISASRKGSELKRCPRCSRNLSFSEFYVDRTRRDGATVHCKSCRDSETEAWRAANAIRVAVVRSAWYGENRESHIEVVKAWQAANADRVREARKARRAAVPEQFRAASRAYYAKNSELMCDLASRRRALRYKVAVGEVDLDSLWDGLCGICGETMDRTLRRPDPMSKSIDHIIPLAKGGTHEQDNLQWAHLVCNMRKGARLAS